MICGVFVLIDTLKLQAKDYKIKQDNRLKTAIVLNERHEENSRVLKYYGEKIPLRIDIDTRNLKKGMFITFEAPTLHHFIETGKRDKCYLPIDPIEMRDLMDSIPVICEELGVEIDPLSLKVSRCDLFKNVNTSLPFVCYNSVFQSLKMDRQRKRDLGTTYTIGNKSRQTCFYDKGLQLGMDSHNCIMRGEERFLNMKTNRKNGVIYAIQLHSQFNELQDIYRDYMKEKVFHRSFEEVRDSVGEETEDKLKLATLLNEEKFHKALELYGVMKLQEEGLVGTDFIRQVLNAKGENKRTIRRQINEYEKAQEDTMKLIENSQFRDLYNELQEKFVA